LEWRLLPGKAATPNPHKFRNGIAWLRTGIRKFSALRGYGKGEVFSTRGEGEGNSPLVEIHKNVRVEAEDPEQKVDMSEETALRKLLPDHSSQICVI
jgi:hypothetical protein